jgi:FRG domain-containing protein
MIKSKSNRVNSVSDFLDLVAKFTRSWFQEEPTWGPWFRGEADVNWRLRPKLYRDPQPKRDIRVLDDEFRQEFIVRAPGLSPERPQNSWEWYFLMQHSGAPTRLLDWTESALIALYFAVRNKSSWGGSKNDSAVWVLEPWKLNEYVVAAKEVIAPGASGLAEVDAARYQPWLPTRYGAVGLEKPLPVAIYPTHFHRRISSQRSCFTIHGSSRDGFEELPEAARRYLQRIVIPHSRTHQIEAQLAVAGIDEVTIFPDLDGLGRWLTMVLRDESRET